MKLRALGIMIATWLAPLATFGGECCDVPAWTDTIGVGGWLEQGFTWNPDSPNDRFNGPVSQNDRSNEYQLNQLYLFAERPTEVGDEFDVGFRLDALFGTDAEFFQSEGLDSGWVSSSTSRFYQFALPQMYVETFVPVGSGVRLQFGKWYSVTGYETGLAPDDFFYSKPIGLNPTPYTHTGAQALFDLSDNVAATIGIHQGSDVFFDDGDRVGIVGSAEWTSCDDRTTLTFAMVGSPRREVDPDEDVRQLLYSFTLQHRLGDRLQYVANHDLYFQDGDLRAGEGYGLQQYLIYDVSEAVSVGGRVEVYRDRDAFGNVGSGLRSMNPASPGWYTNLTLGANYRPTCDWTIRPEIRWDWQGRDDSRTPPAFDDGTDTRQFLFAVDAVYVF